MPTIVSLTQSPAVDLNALANNPNIRVLLVNLDGTGLTGEHLTEALSRLISSLPPEPPPHRMRPDSYRRFLTGRQLKDDADSAALYDKLAAITPTTRAQEKALDQMPVPLVCWDPLWTPELGIGNAADLAATSRQQLLRYLLQRTDRRWSFTEAKAYEERAPRDIAAVNGWLMARCGIELIDEGSTRKAQPETEKSLGAADDFVLFCRKFELPDNETSREGYRRLTVTGWAEAELSIRVTNIFEGQDWTTLIEPCRRSAIELLNIRNFGETSLKELQHKASEISGLSLRW